MLEHCVDSFHRRSHRVLRGEDAVALLGFRELADEGEVDRIPGHHIRAITRLARHEEGGHVRHHHRHGCGARCGQCRDVLDRDAQMVQPLLRDLLAAAVLHRLLHVIAGSLDEQRVDPDHDLILGLLLEVRLAIHRPTEQPG